MPITDNDKTITFSIPDEKEIEVRRVLTSVYDALSEKGYKPIHQIVGYILSEDPTYITNYKNARSLITKVERDDILNVLVSHYLGV